MLLCVQKRRPQTSLLTIVVITGQCEFERAVGDTSAFARVVHPSAVPTLPTERLHPPRPGAPKLSLPHSRLAQVLLPHQRLDRTRKQQQPAISLAASTRRTQPLGHGLRNDAHGRCASKRKRPVLADAHLPARADAAPCGRAGSAVSEHRPREARPARSSSALRDLRIRAVAPNPSSHRDGARFRRAVLESASCAAEQRAHEPELVLAESASGRPPAAAADDDKRSWRAHRGSSSRFGEFAGWAVGLGGGSSAHLRGHDGRVCRGLVDGRV